MTNLTSRAFRCGLVSAIFGSVRTFAVAGYRICWSRLGQSRCKCRGLTIRMHARHFHGHGIACQAAKPGEQNQSNHEILTHDFMIAQLIEKFLASVKALFQQAFQTLFILRQLMPHRR